jgi:ferric-dicitrate binding protein FerR (iron transport regulator)
MNDNYLRYFDPEVPAEEKERMLRELSLDPDQKKEFEAILKTWSYTSVADFALEELNTSQEYNALISRLNNEVKASGSNRKVVPLSAVIKVAAIAFMLIGLGITAYICYKPVEEIAYNEISTKKGEKAQLKLSDGTSIWLNSSSKLRYPSKLDGKQVDVYLQGEAYFDVTHSDKRLFQVHASDLNIKVLGTAFNVKSYPEEKIVETTLVRGKVRIEGKSRSEDDFVILKPNQKASYVGNHSKLVVTESTTKNLKDRSDDLPQIRELASRTNATVVLSNNVNIKYETSWKDGRLDFVDEQFGLLIAKLERWYGVNISIEDPQLMSVRYTGTFEKENIEQALKALSMSLPFKYKVFKDSVTIFK